MKKGLTMSGSKTNVMAREEVLKAVRAVPSGQDFVWDGVDEDDLPATEEELSAAAGLKAGLPTSGSIFPP